MSVVYSNNFDAETLGTLPAGWTGTYSVVTANAVSGRGLRANNIGADIALYTAASPIADMQVESSFLFVTGAGAGGSVGHLLRMDSGYLNGYAIVIGSINATSVNVSGYKRVAGAFTGIGGTTPAMTFAAGNVVTIRTRIIGGAISVWVWNATTGSMPASPTWTVTDTTITAPGYAGLYNVPGASATNVTADNFVLDDTATGYSYAPNDAGIFYSPYTWDVTSARAKTINNGAYFKTMFTGASCTLRFDLGGLATPYPRLLIRVDGRVTQAATLASTVAVTLPTDQDNTKHLLEVFVDATSEIVGRWSPQQTAVALIGIALASSSETLSLPTVRPKRLLVYGDSITEGVRSLAFSAATDVARNSSMVSWVVELAARLNAEYGNIGFGGTGLSVAGSGGVPRLSDSWNLLWSGQSRSFASAPDYCVWLEGANDGATDTTTLGLSALNGQLAAMSTTKFFLFRPLGGGSQGPYLAAIAAGCNAPSRVLYMDTTGYWASSEASDSLHPYGWVNLAKVGPAMATAIQAALGSGSGGGTPAVVVNLGDVGITGSGALVSLV